MSSEWRDSMELTVTDEERLVGVNEKRQLQCGCVKRWYGGCCGFREKGYKEHVNQYTLSDGRVYCIANSYREEITLCQSHEEEFQVWQEQQQEVAWEPPCGAGQAHYNGACSCHGY